MVVRGWNTNSDSDKIIESLEIKPKQFSKTMNKILNDWHSTQKQKELEKIEAKPEVKVIG